MSLKKECQWVKMEEVIMVAGQASATNSVNGNNGVPTIQVNTPATLPEGSTLEADVEGCVITITAVSTHKELLYY
jgi:hypothetical protein